MTFEVFVYPIIFDRVPAERRDKIKKALLDLEDPLPGGNKKEIKGSMKTYYRLRVGECRILYIREQYPLKQGLKPL